MERLRQVVIPYNFRSLRYLTLQREGGAGGGQSQYTP